MAILRIDGVLDATGHRSKTSIYNAVQAGMFTKPVRIEQQTTGWPDYEVQAIVAAQVAGQTPEEIRTLVNQLHTQRVERFKTLVIPITPTSASMANIANVVPLKGVH